MENSVKRGIGHVPPNERGIRYVPHNEKGTRYAPHNNDMDNPFRDVPYMPHNIDMDDPFGDAPCAPHNKDMGKPFQSVLHAPIDDDDDMLDPDNPFHAVLVDGPPGMLSKTSCIFIAGVPREHYQTFLHFAKRAFCGIQPYCRRMYFNSVLVAYDNISWIDSTGHIKQLIDYLRALGSINTPVAYARLCDGIEAYANQAGYSAFRNKVYWNPEIRKMEFAPGYDLHSDID